MHLRKYISHVLLLVLLVTLAVPARGTEPEPVEIATVEDLLAMAENPGGSYILTADLDMTGIPWKSLDFTGSFDGNGHAIVNLTLSQPSDQRPQSYDGNNKGYETAYVGFFGTLVNAQVKNLKLLNVRALVETDEPCFLAGIAGYADHSLVENCTVTGCLELRAHDRMFGVAGILGSGNGAVKGCTLDMTLICTDTDSAAKDEQFLGGVFGTGFVSVTDCDITLDAYISDHGYVHSGGIGGMYMRYPLKDWKTVGYITGNRVTGKITFFEDNRDRRAYCEAEIGEPLADNTVIADNTLDFLRDERFVYDTELRPEICETPSYTQEVIPATCQSYGYTVHTCTGCGYSCRDSYTLLSGHATDSWTLVEPATEDHEGLSRGNCDTCGFEMERTEPKLTPAPSTQPTEPATEAPGEEETTFVPWAPIGAAIVCCVILPLANRKRKSREEA